MEEGAGEEGGGGEGVTKACIDRFVNDKPGAFCIVNAGRGKGEEDISRLMTNKGDIATLRWSAAWV